MHSNSPLTTPTRPVVPFGVRLTAEQHAALLATADRLDCSRSSLARLALARGLEAIQMDQAA